MIAGLSSKQLCTVIAIKMLMCLLLQLFMDGYVADTFPAAYITALLKHPHWWLLHSIFQDAADGARPEWRV